MPSGYSAAPFSRVARQLGNLLLITGYTGNGKNCAGKFNFFVTIFRTVLHDTFDYSAAPFSCVARQFDNLLLITRYDLGSR